MLSEHLMNRIRNHLASEGSTDWMYLDSEGYVTVGCGTMLSSAESAQKLPFVHKGTKKPATAAEIQAAWDLLAAGAEDQRDTAREDKFAAKHYESATDLRIDARTVSSLRDAYVRADYEALKKIYPNFEKFPENAKLALFDMIYNLGAGHKKTHHHRATGMMQYKFMNAAINQGHWLTASSHCLRHGIPNDRNMQTQALFRSCAPKTHKMHKK
jgi:GH24 family phage-related lysozyme (muramidase)